ncbi:MAG TPA: alpha/beta fold hydrolase [Stellaceae bacterium]|nr:alpha/beta fold hydrolase [Stellaceae bacterium]
MDGLPAGLRSRQIEGVNGLSVHVLEAGFEEPGRPCVLLLHGFPELAYSWRNVMVPIAARGFHVVAPDQRGYGRTLGWDGRYDGDLASFGILNLVRDALALIEALGYRSVAAVVGHDFGSPVAAYCALIRPDVFRSVALMSAPFSGPPSLTEGGRLDPRIHDELARLTPPRKHYQWYFSRPEADDEMRFCRQGLSDFLRAYYHYKSADWPGNTPFPLASWTASELAKLPRYYVMDLEKGMAETVAEAMPSPAEVAACSWLNAGELEVYAAEFGRTGFQGGLQWYRCGTLPRLAGELSLFAGRTIDVPSCFIAGKSDWGIYQSPGQLERMQTRASTNMRFCRLVEGAGHWVQQERPEQVSAMLGEFLSLSR